VNLYIRIDKHGDIESVGPLPVRARRHDTGELVNPADWLRACGYYDVETATVDDLPASLTAEQRTTIIAAVVASRNKLAARRFWIADTFQAWALAKDVGQDYLDNIPERPVPPGPSPTVPQQVAFIYASLSYLATWNEKITRWIVGGGTVTSPGLGDVLKVTVEVVAELLEQADEVEPPA
jgi:hypothetical protein